jgi:hypothetical protein
VGSPSGNSRKNTKLGFWSSSSFARAGLRAIHVLMPVIDASSIVISP